MSSFLVGYAVRPAFGDRNDVVHDEATGVGEAETVIDLFPADVAVGSASGDDGAVPFL